MARRVKISVIGDAASYAAAVRKGIAATGDLEVSLVELQTAAVKTTEVQIAASLKREARLRTEAKAAKGFSASLTEDAFARNAADNATIRSQQKLSRGLGYTTQAEVAKSAAAVEIESTMAVKQALETKIAAFRAAAADETRTVGQRETSNELAVKTEKELARVMGVTAASAAASAKEQAAGLKEVEAENLSAAEVAKAAAEADFAARMKKIEGLDLEIAAHKEAAAAAGPGVEQTQMNNLAQQKQLQLDKLLADASQAKAAAEVNGAKSINASLDETIALREAEIKTIREEIVELQTRARAAKAGSPAQFAIAGELAVRQKRLGVLEKAGAPLAVPTVLTAHDKASSFVKDEAARLHGLREEIIATEALATDDTLLSNERNIAAKRTRQLYRELANAISEEGVAAKGAGAVIREQTERQIALSIQKQKALQAEIDLTIKAAEAHATTSAEWVALDEKRLMLIKALNSEIEQSAVAQNVSMRAAAKTSKEFNTGVRGVLAGSGVFKMLGRSLAFASSGFLAFSLGAFAIRKAVDNAVELQKQMEYLHTQAGATTVEVTKMTGAVERLAPALGTNPDVLAKGLYHIESAGLRGKKAVDALTVAAKGAVIGGSDLEDTATALIATWKSGVSGVTSFATAMSAANAIVGAGNMRMQDLVKSLSTPLLATAKTAGISIDGIGAALDVLTIKWGPNSNAATRLAMAINLLSSPTAQAQKELAKIGITQTELGDAMRNRGLPAALDILKSKMEEMGLTATQQGILLTRAFGGGRSSGAVKVLIQSIDDLRKKQHQIAEQIGTLDEKWAATVKTAEFAGRRWKASVSAIETELGANLLPTLTKTANGFAHWMSQEKNQAAIQHDFADGIKVTGFALKTTWAAAQPFISGFQQMSRTVGGATHGVELLAAALVSAKLHQKFFSSFKFAEIVTGFKTIATYVGVAGASMEALTESVAVLGAMIMKNAKMFGLIAAVGGTQIHNLPGLNNAAGRGIGDVVSNTGAGMFAGSFFGRNGTIIGTGLGLGRGLHQAIGGTGGDFAGNIVSGAAIGATKGPYGALAGAAIGLTKSFIDLAMSGHSAADELKKISHDRSQAQFAVRRAAIGVQSFRDRKRADTVQRNTQADYVAEAKADEKATRGTRQHRAAVDQLLYAQSEYRALVRQLKVDEANLGTAIVNQKKARQDENDQTNKMVKKLQDLATASRELKNVPARWSNIAAAQKTSAQKLQDYVQKMNKLGDSFANSDPKMAAVYHQLAKIAIQLGLIPSSKTIDVYYREHHILIPGKGASTPHRGQQGRADQYPGTGNVMVPTEPPKTTPRPIRTLTMPRRFAIQEAKAITDKQEIVAAKARLAFVNNLIASGRLIGDAYVDALNEKKSDIQTIASYAKTQAKKGKSTSISKLVDPKIRDKVAQAAAAYAADANKETTAAYVKALKEEREWVQRRLKQGHLTGNQKVALDNEIKSINTKISAALKKTIKDNWDIPLKLQLAQAKAGATLTNTDDLNVAEKIKSAAQKALSSGKLGIKAQIDAWNAITSANEALSSSWLKSRNMMHAVSVRALLSGIQFKTLLDKQEAEARLAQARGHRGYAPNKGAIFGNPVGKATGGAIPGVGSGDTVPAMLTPGEIVLNRRQQRNTRKMLGIGDGSPDELFGRINRFAGGGVAVQHFKTGGPAGGVSTSDAREIALRVLRQRIHPDKPVHFFRNALADAKSIVNPKTYLQIVKHPVESAKGTFSFYKDLVKHPLTTFEQHPVFTALALKGAVKGVVRGGGLASRGTAGVRAQYAAESAAARAEQPFNLFKDWAEAFHGPESVLSGNPGSIAGFARKAAKKTKPSIFERPPGPGPEYANFFRDIPNFQEARLFQIYKHSGRSGYTRRLKLPLTEVYTKPGGKGIGTGIKNPFIRHEEVPTQYVSAIAGLPAGSRNTAFTSRFGRVSLYRGEGPRTAEHLKNYKDPRGMPTGQFFTQLPYYAKAYRDHFSRTEGKLLKVTVPRSVAAKAASDYDEFILPPEIAAMAKETISSRLRRSSVFGPKIEDFEKHVEILKRIKEDIHLSRRSHYSPRGLYFKKGERPTFTKGYTGQKKSLGDLSRYTDYQAPKAVSAVARTMVGAAKVEAVLRRPHIRKAFSRLHEERGSVPFSERLLNRFYAFHGTDAEAGRSIAKEGFIRTNQLGRAFVGDFGIARKFADMNIEGGPGAFAVTRRGRAERGQAMIAKTDPIRALGVVGNVDRHTTPMRAFAGYLLDRHKLGPQSAIFRLFHEERGSINMPERKSLNSAAKARLDRALIKAGMSIGLGDHPPSYVADLVARSRINDPVATRKLGAWLHRERTKGGPFFHSYTGRADRPAETAWELELFGNQSPVLRNPETGKTIPLSMRQFHNARAKIIESHLARDRDIQMLENYTGEQWVDLVKRGRRDLSVLRRAALQQQQPARLGREGIAGMAKGAGERISKEAQGFLGFMRAAREPVATGPKPVSDLFAPDFSKMGPAPDVIARTEKTARMRENFTKMMEKSDRMAKYEKMGRPLAGHEPLHRGEYFMGGFGRLMKQIDTYRTFYDVARDKGLPNALRKRPANTVEVADKFGVSWIDLLVAGRGKLGDMSMSVPAFVKAHQRLKRFAKSRSDVGGEISKAAMKAGYGGHGRNVYGLIGDQTVGPGMASWMAVADWLGQSGKREMLGKTGRVYHNQRYSFEKLQQIGEEFSKHRNAGGGVIGGSGMGDTVPALLSPGEMVLNRRQQRSLGRAVGAADPAALFSKIKRFAGGGFVSDHRIAWRTSSDQRITATKVSIVAQQASLNRPGAMGMGVTSVHGDNIVINVSGAKDSKQTAKDVLNELQKHRKRNAAQRRGRHGGHSSVGLT